MAHPSHSARLQKGYFGLSFLLAWNYSPLPSAVGRLLTEYRREARLSTCLSDDPVDLFRLCTVAMETAVDGNNELSLSRRPVVSPVVPSERSYETPRHSWLACGLWVCSSVIHSKLAMLLTTTSRMPSGIQSLCLCRTASTVRGNI
jgi:hypothetical protein